ncbi:MAG: hypothetical protein ACHQHO_11055 [Solirubrobacterales bacterium]
MVSSLAPHAPDPADLSRLELFAEQLDLAAQLVRAGGLARDRMALVAIDNLAEVLLYRHVQFTFDASEQMGGRLAVRRYDQRERDRLRRDFDRRITLAQTELTGPFVFAFPKPLLDQADAVTFRVAHRYRNGIYHEDRHNQALLDPLARLYLVAVGRAWCRAQPASSMGGLGNRLDKHPHVARTARAGVVSFPDAAQRITNNVLHSLDVDPRDLAERLAADLRQRADGTDEARRELTRCGLVQEAHAEMLRAAELRHLHRADPELVRLQDEASGILGDLVARGDNGDNTEVEDLQARFQSAEEGQRERVDELRIGFRPELNLGTASAIRKAAKRLEQLRDLPRTLMRYETHDRRLALLEGCLAWIDREWDHLMTTEEDLARGK